MRKASEKVMVNKLGCSDGKAYWILSWNLNLFDDAQHPLKMVRKIKREHQPSSFGILFISCLYFKIVHYQKSHFDGKQNLEKYQQGTIHFHSLKIMDHFLFIKSSCMENKCKSFQIHLNNTYYAINIFFNNCAQ